MSKYKFLIIFFFFIASLLNSSAVSVNILAKIHDQIITNIDISIEKKYLLFLNPKLKELKKERLNKIAKNSLIKEIIKKREIEKYFNLEVKGDLFYKIEENFLKRSRITNKDKFIEYLKNKELNYEIILDKIQIEGYWNQLVYDKYKNNVKINEEYLRRDTLMKYKNKSKKVEYNISEILFTETVNEDFNQTTTKIKNTIDKIGFENSANIFSISNTSKKGGLIGWINEIQISDIIKKKIIDLEINEISEPIKIEGGYLIIKLNNKRELKEKINLENEIKALINKETNRQLNAFSNIFYKRLKKNILINEY